MGRPQVPDWALPFRWSAGLSHPRRLACWSPRELRAACAGRVWGLASGVRLPEVEPMLLRRLARLPGGAATATAAWCRAASSPPLPRDPLGPLSAWTWERDCGLFRDPASSALVPARQAWGLAAWLRPASKPGAPRAASSLSPAGSVQNARLRASPAGPAGSQRFSGHFTPLRFPGSPAVTICQIRSP